MKLKVGNPWLIFSPFLAIFILLVLKLHSDKMEGDESRYFMYAQNLLQGFYSPKNVVFLWNGPGYPLFLVPFLYFKLPLITISLANAIMQYMSIVFLFKSIKAYTNTKVALLASLAWGVYYLGYQEIPSILTEPLTSFLMSSLLVSLSSYFTKGNKNYLYVSGIIIGLIVLTKFIFGYILLFMLIFWVAVYLIYQMKKIAQPKIKSLIIALGIAFVLVTPYLAHTYQLTSRIFYWGNSGGMNLYWMSTPYENEFGDWFPETLFIGQAISGTNLYKNHLSDINYFLTRKGIERDDAYKQKGIENIKKYPLKYIRNWFTNQGRLWFNFPQTGFSHSERGLLRFVPNAILLTFFLLSLYLWGINFKKCPIEINFLALFILSYLGMTSLISALPRQLTVSVPILLFWISFIQFKSTKVTIKFD
jgi:4-amino-4-deoxy-L-arabinose transferase-like glycosyltransferase